MSRRGGGRGNSLRRGSGGGGPAPFDPASVGTLAWWLAGDDVTLNGADVSSWNDKSGNGRHWTQGTAADQPLFVASAMNGQPGVTFDAANTEWLNGPNLAVVGLTAAESFLVIRVNTDPPIDSRSGLWAVGSSATAGSLYPFATGIIFDEFGSTTRPSTVNPTPALTSPRIYGSTSAAGEKVIRLDGTQIYANATNVVGWNTAPMLGNAYTSRFLDGTLCEWLVYAAVLSAGSRASVNGYLKAKYGIA